MALLRFRIRPPNVGPVPQIPPSTRQAEWVKHRTPSTKTNAYRATSFGGRLSGIPPSGRVPARAMFGEFAPVMQEPHGWWCTTGRLVKDGFGWGVTGGSCVWCSVLGVAKRQRFHRDAARKASSNSVSASVAAFGRLQASHRQRRLGKASWRNTLKRPCSCRVRPTKHAEATLLQSRSSFREVLGPTSAAKRPQKHRTEIGTAPRDRTSPANLAEVDGGTAD